jgi:hypothetical protein
MLDNDTIAVQVGKKAADRVLGGREWLEFPGVHVMTVRHVGGVSAWTCCAKPLGW